MRKSDLFPDLLFTASHVLQPQKWVSLPLVSNSPDECCSGVLQPFHTEFPHLQIVPYPLRYHHFSDQTPSKINIDQTPKKQLPYEMAFTRTMIFWYTLSNFQEGNASYALPMFITPKLQALRHHHPRPPKIPIRAEMKTTATNDLPQEIQHTTESQNERISKTVGNKTGCSNTEVSFCWYKIFQRKSPPFTEFPSVLRFFRDGITQANAAPVTSSLPPSR